MDESKPRRSSSKGKQKNNHDYIEKQVLEVIQIQKDPHAEIGEVLSILKEKIQMDLVSLGVAGRVAIQGSFVRKTYLSDDDSFDLLIILPKSEKPNVHSILDSLLKRLKKDRVKKEKIEVTKITGKIPYLRLFAGNEKIHLFVGFDISQGEEKISIFDYIPYHSQYILTHMDKKVRKDVVLLKKFTKAIGVYRDDYGAIGFNGYLCELLILFYGSFRETLKGICKWRARTVIDIKKARLKFEDVDELSVEMIYGYYPIYVPDPLYRKENIAADVSVDQFNSIIAAANYYLSKPSLLFFEESLYEIPLFNEIVHKVVNSKKEIIVLAIPRNFQESGVSWQKALSIRKALEQELIKHYYMLERSKPFVSDDYYGTILSLMTPNPQLSQRKEGPEIISEESVKFLDRYAKHMDVISGPFIDYGKWVVYFSKRGQPVYEFISALVKKNAFILNVDSFLKLEIKEKLKVIGVDQNLQQMYETDDSFAENLFLFVVRKPLWVHTLEFEE